MKSMKSSKPRYIILPPNHRVINEYNYIVEVKDVGESVETEGKILKEITETERERLEKLCDEETFLSKEQSVPVSELDIEAEVTLEENIHNRL